MNEDFTANLSLTINALNPEDVIAALQRIIHKIKATGYRTDIQIIERERVENYDLDIQYNWELNN